MPPPPPNPADLERLGKMISNWGGRLTLVPRGHFNAIVGAVELEPGHKRSLFDHVRDNNPWSEAPFLAGHAVRWDIGTVIADSSRVHVPALIHEAGHVFASKVPPDSADEFAWLGWEYVLARKLGATEAWIAGNKDYGLGDLEFGDLTEASRLDLLAERIQEGIRQKIISPDLEPLPVRRPLKRRPPIPDRVVSDRVRR